MPSSFINENPEFGFEGVGPYPGSSAFLNALKYYQQNLRQQGSPQAQLASSQASAGPAAQYQVATEAGGVPGSGGLGGFDAFKNLQTGMAGARSAGRAAGSEATLGDVGGAADTASAYGNSIGGAIRGELATNAASQSNAANTIGTVIDAGKLATAIGSEIVAPGNPMGIQMGLSSASSLAGRASGGGGGGGGGGFGGGFGSPFSSSPTGQQPATNTASLPSGFQPIGQNSFSPGSLPPWIDPNDITAFSGGGGDGSGGIFSGLFGAGAF